LMHQGPTLLITNAMVLDGTGAPARRASVRVRGERIVAVGREGTFVWDIHSGQLIAALKDTGTVVAASRTGTRVVRVGAGTASSWELASNRLRDLVVPGDAVRAAAISADGSVVATGGQSGTIWLWNGSTGEHLDSLRFGGAPIRALDFNFDDTSLVATTTTGAVRVLACEICRPPGALVALARRRVAG